MTTRTQYCSLALLIILFMGCFPPSTTIIKNAKNWIPPDFNPQNTILLVQKSYEMTSEEKEMESYIKKKYPYRFQFATIVQINDIKGQYSDTALYRYALVNTVYTVPQYPRNFTDGRDFKFYDRANFKHYPETRWYAYKKKNAFKPIINTIVDYYKK